MNFQREVFSLTCSAENWLSLASVESNSIIYSVKFCGGTNSPNTSRFVYKFITGVSKEQQRAVNDEKGHEFIRGTSGVGVVA